MTVEQKIEQLEERIRQHRAELAEMAARAALPLPEEIAGRLRGAGERARRFDTLGARLDLPRPEELTRPSWAARSSAAA